MAATALAAPEVLKLNDGRSDVGAWPCNQMKESVRPWHDTDV